MKNLLPFLFFCIQPFMAPDDGGAGGGSSSGTVDLSEWIKRLKEAAKRDRPGIVEELAKVLDFSVEDTWMKLKEAGWGSKKDKPGSVDGEPPDTGDTQIVALRHTTPYPRYHRAGLALTGEFKSYSVTAGQLEKLKKDPWVEIGKK